jgi:malate synthase
VEIRGPLPPEGPEIFPPEVLGLLVELSRELGERRNELLARRADYQARVDLGSLPSFAETTRELRRAPWTVEAVPAELRDRRVEITGPTDRKMMINALNSGAQVFMADLEDSHAPFWSLTVRGQQNLFEAARGKLELVTPEGKEYRLRAPHATLMVRPRGLHLEESGLWVDGHPIPASIFDLGLFVLHNAKVLAARGKGTFVYLPKTQSGEEAGWWKELLSRLEVQAGLRPGSVRATVLIETLPALFQMQEILHELRPNIVGLNFGRWDYLFSFVKTLRTDRRFLLPERRALTMEAPFLVAASTLLVDSCHARGAQAIGGMAADIPVKEDADLNSEAVERVTADKRREFAQGYDGTWVAHPALVPVALAVFREPRPLPKGGGSVREPPSRELLAVPAGPVSEAGVRANVNVAVQYLESWFRGTAAVAIHHRMEDTATAEICRTQLWQWVRLGVALEDGRPLTRVRFTKLMREEMEQVRSEVGENRWESAEFARAQGFLEQLVTSPELEEFLTLAALERISEDRKLAT